jgi:acetyl-CoA synthetase
VNPTEAFRQARDFLVAHRTDYEGACRGFQWPRPERFNWAIDWFDAIARGNTRTALRIVGDGGLDAQLTFDGLRRRSNFLAAHLRSLDVARGDRVLLMLGNVPALWELTLACMKLGCPIIPTTTLLMPSDLRDRLERGAAGVVVTDPMFAERFDGMGGRVLRVLIEGTRAGWQTLPSASEQVVLGDLPANGNGAGAGEAIATGAADANPAGATLATDPLFLYFTSGTTAKPKLVVHTHASYPIGHLSTMYWLGLRPGDRHLNLSSPGWAKHAWSSFFAPWSAEATIVMVNHARFDAASLVRELVRCEVTSFCAPPTVWRAIIQLPLEEIKVSLRELVSAGEPLNPEVITRVRKAWGLTIRDGYGQTETTLQIGNFPGQVVKPGSMGRVAPGYHIELLDSDGCSGNEGEICVSLPEKPVPVTPGYLDDAVNTAHVMAGGFYHAGDIAARDADGYFTYIGRNDDVFKCSDYKISPFELESLLIEHEAVVEAAVVPSPDPQRLSVPKAFIILAAGLSPSRELAASILKFVRDRTSPFKRVRRIEFADLPKTVSGKIRRVDLRKAEGARDLAVSSRNACEYWEEDL